MTDEELRAIVALGEMSRNELMARCAREQRYDVPAEVAELAGETPAEE